MILVENLEPSDYLVTEIQSPEGTQAPEASFATVTEGQTEELEASSEAPVEEEEPTPEPTPTVEPEPTEVPTGDVVVLLQQEDGTPLGGGCFQLVDGNGSSVGGEVCDDDGDVPDDGRTGFLGVEVGSYTLVQTETEDGFEIAADQSVNVVPEGVQVTVINEETPPETGDLQIDRRNQDGQRVPGSCFTVTAQDGTVTGPVCDNGEGDANDDDGRIRINDLVEGEVTVAETQAPEGLLPADPQNTTIDSSQTAQLTFETGASRGRVTVEFRDEDGNPVNGGCAQLTDAADSTLAFCDADDGAEDGQIVLIDFFPGPYAVAVTQPPAGYETPSPQTVEIVAGETATVTFALTLAIGSLEISTVDENNQVLGGACYTIAGPTNAGEVCDNGNGDDASEDGLVRVLNLLAGDYTVTQSTAHGGFRSAAAEQTAAVVAQETASLTFTNAESGGTVEIVKTDENDAPLEGSCFELQGAENYGPVCDNGDGDADSDPGVIRLESVAEGDYAVVETTTPEGYETAANGSVSVTEGEVSTVTVQNLLPPGAVQFVKTDENGDPLGGACFALTGGDGFGPVCDNGDGDGDDAEGTTLIGEVPAGDYGWSETQAPEGYEAVEGGDVTVESGETASVDVQNEPAPPAFGAVEVVKTDENGDPLAESCFSLTGAQNYGPICDNDGNDTNDAEGTLGFAEVAPGDYQAVETSTPDGYQTAADTPVTVTAGETATVEVANEPEPVEDGSGSIRDVDGRRLTSGHRHRGVGRRLVAIRRGGLDRLIVARSHVGEAQRALGVVGVVSVVVADRSVVLGAGQAEAGLGKRIAVLVRLHHFDRAERRRSGLVLDVDGGRLTALDRDVAAVGRFVALRRLRLRPAIVAGRDLADQDRAFGVIAVAVAVVADRTVAVAVGEGEAGPTERIAVLVGLDELHRAGREQILDGVRGDLTLGYGHAAVGGGLVALGGGRLDDCVVTLGHAFEPDHARLTVGVTVPVVTDRSVVLRALQLEAGAFQRSVVLVGLDDLNRAAALSVGERQAGGLLGNDRRRLFGRRWIETLRGGRLGHGVVAGQEVQNPNESVLARVVTVAVVADLAGVGRASDRVAGAAQDLDISIDRGDLERPNGQGQREGHRCRFARDDFDRLRRGRLVPRRRLGHRDRVRAGEEVDQDDLAVLGSVVGVTEGERAVGGVSQLGAAAVDRIAVLVAELDRDAATARAGLERQLGRLG